jgi:DNA-binding phage protein
MQAAKSHHSTVEGLLKADPEFAAFYVVAALDEADLLGGQFALRTVLCQVAQTQGLASLTARACMTSEVLRRELSPRGTLRFKTLLSLLNAMNVRLRAQPLHTGSSSAACDAR